jgi:predicted PurR-regulated permease PerM
MAFAMLPFGACAMFTAASILFVMQGGSFIVASAVFGFGALVMIVGDTLFWPAVVGNPARLPFLVALIGIFGGLQAFGLIGLFLGPVIMVTIFTVWREWIIHKG